MTDPRALLPSAAGLSQKILKYRASAGATRRAIMLCIVLAISFSGIACVLSARKSSVDEGGLHLAYWLLRSIAGHESPSPVGNAQPPGYAIVVTALALITPETSSGLACWGESRKGCQLAMVSSVVVAQFLAALITLGLAFRLAFNLSRDARIALIATILTYFATRPGEFAGVLRPHTWYALFLILYLVLLTEHGGSRSRLSALGAGAALGMVVIFKPIAVVLVPVTLGLLLTVIRTAKDRTRLREVILDSAVFLVGAAVVAVGLLWVAVSHSYDADAMAINAAMSLSQRMAFVGIGRSTSFAAIATSIPTFGGLFSLLLPADEVRRLAIGTAPGTLANEGIVNLFADAFARTGQSSTATIALLLRERLVDQPLAYAASVIPVLSRGLFAGGGLIALIGLFHVPTMLRFARAEGWLSLHLLVVVPVAALLLANALITENSFWHNPMLPFVYAYAIAYVASGW